MIIFQNQEGGLIQPSIQLQTRSDKQDALTQCKADLLEAIIRGEHLVTLLGMACQIIADTTGDPDFLKQARQAVRGLGVSVNHRPSIQEQYESLIEQIYRLQAGLRVEDDPVIRKLYQGMIEVRKNVAAQIGTEQGGVDGDKDNISVSMDDSESEFSMAEKLT